MFIYKLILLEMIETFDDSNKKILDNFLKDKTYIYLTSITKEFKEMALNWYLSLKNIQSEHLALLVCADIESYEYLQSNNVRQCIYLDSNIQNNVTGEDWVENEKNFKLLGLYLVFKNYDVDIIMSDVDIVFLKNPIDKLLSEVKDYDWVVMSDKRYIPFVPNRKQKSNYAVAQHKTEIYNQGISEYVLYGEENAGFSFIPNPTAPWRKKENSGNEKQEKINFLKTFQKNSTYYELFPKGIEEGCLQTIVNTKVKETNLKVKVLSSFEFPNGSVWKVPYIKEKIKNSCYIIHYNFCDYLEPAEVRKEKTNRMKRDGYWYIS